MVHTLIAGDDHPLHQDDHPVQHLSVADYAAAVGLSTATVRRRIRSGELAAVRVDGPYGPEWRIPTGDAYADQPRRSPSASDDVHPDRRDDLPLRQGSDPAMVALIERQQQTIMELSGRLGFYQSEIQHLKAQLEAAQTRILELEGPKEASVEMASHPAHVENGPNSGSEKGSARPWWKFW